MYMNCAAIEITGTTGEDNIKFDDRPEIFVANLPPNGGECQAPPGDVDFPQPGPDVLVASGATRVKPTGNCGEAQQDPANEVIMADADILELGLKPLKGASQSAATKQGSVNEAPAEVADGNRKAEVKPAASPKTAAIESPAGAPSPAAPVPVAAAPEVETASSGSAGAAANGDSCPEAENGFWHCIEGSQFQRCVSGTWSAAQPLAPGTACTPGKGPELQVGPATAKRGVRFAQPHVRRHASRHRI